MTTAISAASIVPGGDVVRDGLEIRAAAGEQNAEPSSLRRSTRGRAPRRGRSRVPMRNGVSPRRVQDAARPRRASAWRTARIMPTPRLKRAAVIVVGNVADAAQHLEDRRHGPGRRYRWPAARPSRQHARRVVGDAAAGDVRGASQQARRHRARESGAGSCGAPSAARRPTVQPSFRQRSSWDRSRRPRTAACAPASSRWCAARWRAGRASTSPARIALPVSSCAALDRAHDEARQVVLAGGVESRHLGRLAADQGAAVRPAAARDARHHLRRPRRRRACRPRNNPGKTAASRPAPRCRSRSG